jgi:hypothetical protein
MRCDGCQHWKKESENEEWEAKEAGFGECLAVRERWRITDEVSPKPYEADSDEDENSFVAMRTSALQAARAYVQDGSQYRAELFTAPDFFCALFDAATPVGAA